jgi:N-acetylneuraminic acid mutarotase
MNERDLRGAENRPMTTMTRIRNLALCFAIAGAAACANGNDDQGNQTPDAGPDSSIDVGSDTPVDTHPDVAPTDTGRDTGPSDTGGEISSDASDASSPDTSTKCAYPDTETRPCGHCGKQTRFCLPSDVWTGWSGCAGEIVGDVECSVGETRVSDCGNCGKSTDICDPVACTFVTGSCAGEGPCSPGDVETTSASCPAGLIRTHTCGDTCTWSPFSDCASPTGWLAIADAPTTFTGRHDHTAVWSGTEMLVFGGNGSSVKNDGAAYRPSSNTWRTLATAGSLSGGRYQHVAVWTGSKMIVWGGQDSSFGTASYHNDGAIYDPSTDTWTPIPAAPIVGRKELAAVWSTTTDELVVWGGAGYNYPYPLGDGAAYSPSAGTWRKIATAPLTARYNSVAAWTGTEMIVWGGTTGSTQYADGARYDPLTNSWISFPLAALAGRFDTFNAFGGGALFIAGGYYGSYTGGSQVSSDGALYYPGAGWSPISTPDTTTLTGGLTRYGGAAWYGGSKFFVFGGAGTSSSSIAGAASYDPATDAWTAIDPTGAPGARYHTTVVWTGDEAIVWGGESTVYGGTYFANGAAFRPAP